MYREQKTNQEFDKKIFKSKQVISEPNAPITVTKLEFNEEFAKLLVVPTEAWNKMFEKPVEDLLEENDNFIWESLLNISLVVSSSLFFVIMFAIIFQSILSV